MEKPIFIHKGAMSEAQTQELESINVWLNEWHQYQKMEADYEAFIAENEAKDENRPAPTEHDPSTACDRVRKVLEEKFPYDTLPKVGQIRTLAARYQADDVSDRKVLIMSFSRDSMMVQVCPVAHLGVPCGRSELRIKSPSDAEENYEQWVLCLWDTKEVHYDQFFETWVMDTLDEAAMNQVWDAYRNQVAAKDTEEELEGFFWPFNPVEEYQKNERAFYAPLVEEAYALLEKDAEEKQGGEDIIPFPVAGTLEIYSADDQQGAERAANVIAGWFAPIEVQDGRAAAGGIGAQHHASPCKALSIAGKPDYILNFEYKEKSGCEVLVYKGEETSSDYDGWSIGLNNDKMQEWRQLCQIKGDRADMPQPTIRAGDVFYLLPPHDGTPLLLTIS